MFTCFKLALTLTSVANVLITMSAGPLLTALAARLGLGHRLPLRTWAAILAAGSGIAWIYARQLGTGGWTGILVAAAVPLAGAVNWTLVQRNQDPRRQVDLAPAVLIGALLSASLTLPLAWPLQASARDLAWLAGLGLWQLALPCVLAVVCARSLSAPEMSLLALLEVLFGIALAWLGADEVPPPSTLQGGALVIAALLLNEWLGRRERLLAAAGSA
jgi:drug/metabolite transporter (DMT)-like permease